MLFSQGLPGLLGPALCLSRAPRSGARVASPFFSNMHAPGSFAQAAFLCLQFPGL
jgi:hypothetical protein